MSVLDQIEKKFGFKLPPSYRVLAEAGTLDEEFQLADGYIMTPEDLADFEWEDFMNPIEGLVPFAYNGAGEPYCWLTQEAAVDGELPIIAAMHGGEGYWFAPTVTAMICRELADWLGAAAGEEDAIEDLADIMPPLMALIKEKAPEHWVEAINHMQADFLETNADEEPLLQTDPSYTEPFFKDFGEAYTDHEIEWETRG